MEKEINAQDEFIDQLLLNNNISLRAIYKYADEHMKELEQAENIFDLKEEKDEKFCLALFRLMAGKYAADISKSFCERYNITDSSVDDIFFEKNKLFLIAAFIYNPSFFAMSWNLCGIIRSQLAYQAEMQEDVREPETGESSDRIEYIAASPEGPGFKEFGTPLENKKGVLVSRGAQFDVSYLQLIFRPKAELPDIFIDVRFTVKGKYHTLRLYKEDEIFISNPEEGKGIDYKNGIENIDFPEETDNNDE